MTTAAAGPRTRRRLGWVIVLVLLVGAGLAAAALSGLGQWTQRDGLDPDSARPDGARALARTLTAHGVPVTVVRSADEARATEGTLVVGDTAVLSDDRVAQLADAGRDVVLLAPSSRDVRVLFHGAVAGFGSGAPIEPGCGFPPAERAGAVAVGTVFEAEETTWSCYPDAGGHGLLARDRGDGILVAVDGVALFSNELIAKDGDAALALALLGRTGAVTWYVPSIGDASGATPATLGSLTPGWVTPAVLLLVAAAAVAAVWRGRRFGPLVAERLPVTVRGGETTRGRALLYARSRDAAHAGALLRDAARHRLARELGLPQDASAEAVADAAAGRIRASGAQTSGAPADPRETLLGPPPSTDAELTRLASALARLETAVSSRVRPSAPGETPTHDDTRKRMR